MKSARRTLYERNLFYQQLNFKYVLFRYVRALVLANKSHGRARTAGLTFLFLLLYLLDFILGAAVLLVLVKDPELKLQARKLLSLYTKSSLEWCQNYLQWLMGVPWGIKLNTPLSHFLGTRYIYILDMWKLFYSEFIAAYLSVFVDFLLVLLPFSATLTVMALHDFLKFLNLCLICFFIISSRVLVLQLSALKSLGRLFIGRKWNVLKKRVDTYDHSESREQLLVGTIIFTILLFLLPTTGMYTLAFFYLRVIQFLVQFCLRVCCVCMNKFTLSLLGSLHASLQDQSLAGAEVLIRGMRLDEYARKKVATPYRVVDGRRCSLEFFSVDNSEVTVLWNGREYSVEEMREVVDSIPQEALVRDVEHHMTGGRSSSQSSGGERTEANLSASSTDDANTLEVTIRNHPMVHWFWTLPGN